MNLFDAQSRPFEIGDRVQLRTGYDMYIINSRCRIHAIESGSYLLVPWLLNTKKEIAAMGRWLMFTDAGDLYEKLEAGQ